MKIVIAGAGIGGLFAGITLSEAGHDVEVLEQHAEIRPAGAGITMWANALKLFERYGVLDDVLAHAGTIEASEFRDTGGRTLTHVSMSSLVELFGFPVICMHRADLSDILVRRLGPDRVRTGAAVTGYTDLGDGVEVHLADGTSTTGDVLVGADGIHSAVRSQLFPDVRPSYDGQAVWRGMVDAPAGLDRTATSFVAFGRGSRAGWSPMGRGRIYWFGVRFQPENTPDPADGAKAELLREFSGWAEPIPQLIEATDPADILRNDVQYIAPLSAWGAGRVTLLGDAAHATPPQVAQGACLAVEDATVLALRLGQAFTVEAGLRRYEAERRPRTTKVLAEAERIAKLAAMTGPVTHRIRNLAMRLTPDKAMIKAFAATAAYEVPA